jgi:hypothetical protein
VLAVTALAVLVVFALPTVLAALAALTALIASAVDLPLFVLPSYVSSCPEIGNIAQNIKFRKRK